MAFEAVKKYELNKKGHDFIVGDIHGAFNLLDRAMDSAGFDPTVDRLFSLGDLIDRGPNSGQALEFLSRPYVHAIRGNHEAAFIDIFSGYKENNPISKAVKQYYANTFLADWLMDVEDAFLFEMLSAFEKLPYAMEVEAINGQTGMVHGDIYGDNWNAFTDGLRQGDSFIIEEALWGRERVLRGTETIIKGIDQIYIGHTIVPFVRSLGNVFAIDTGAIFKELKSDLATSEKLTLISLNADQNRFYQYSTESDSDFVVIR